MIVSVDDMGMGWVNGWEPYDRRPASQIAAELVRNVGGAFGDKFDLKKTPWNIAPLDGVATFDSLGRARVRTWTHVKPNQAGGSLAGECALCIWLKRGTGGDVQNNWEDNDKALDRWDKRLEKILKATLSDMWPTDRTKAKRGLVIFDKFNLTVQGVFTEDNLDSDSVKYQLNEEVHNWEPGRLAKAYKRTTAFLDSCVRFNISNASEIGSELHKAFLSGTQRVWETECPACKKRHAMHAELYRDGRIGGLKYDSKGCKREDGSYDYNKMKSSVHYEFDCCGYRVYDNEKEREKLFADYSAPRNSGAPPTNESTILEAVSIPYIPFIELIQEKHSALFALNHGDPEPWWIYLTHRECRFIDKGEDRPIVEVVTLTPTMTKNREGMPDRVARFAALDRQRGRVSRGETPHWWLVIRDFNAKGDSQLVWEGKCSTSGNAVEIINRHGVRPTSVVADSGDGSTTTDVYRFCLENGFNAIKGSGEAYFSHKNGGRKIFSEEDKLHRMLNAPPARPDNPGEEPLFWLYSKAGIRDRLFWVRGSDMIKWSVPSDVSQDYLAHMDAERMNERKHPRTGETITEFVQVRKRNDLFVCECYCIMLAEMAQLIGAPAAQTKTEVKEYQLSQ